MRQLLENLELEEKGCSPLTEGIGKNVKAQYSLSLHVSFEKDKSEKDIHTIMKNLEKEIAPLVERRMETIIGRVDGNVKKNSTVCTYDNKKSKVS